VRSFCSFWALPGKGGESRVGFSKAGCWGSRARTARTQVNFSALLVVCQRFNRSSRRGLCKVPQGLLSVGPCRRGPAAGGGGGGAPRPSCRRGFEAATAREPAQGELGICSIATPARNAWPAFGERTRGTDAIYMNEQPRVNVIKPLVLGTRIADSRRPTLLGALSSASAAGSSAPRALG